MSVPWAAVASGATGAIAGSFAKAAFRPLPLEDLLSVTGIVRAVLFVAVIAVNGVMLRLLMTAMQRHGTVTSIVASNGANFVSSAILGAVLYGETPTPRWLLGASLMLCGVYLIVRSQPQASSESVPKEKSI